MHDRSATPPDSPAQSGGVARAIGRYVVRRRLGAGGFARVYLAWDPELEIEVAIKVLRAEYADDDAVVERFRREASTAARLRHPNVITVLTVGRLEQPFDGAPPGAPYLVMDYLPASLAGRLAERGVLPEGEVLRIGSEIACGLAYAHAQGVVHRDVKPDNVLFTGDGRAVVTDLGIARAVAAAPSSRSRQVVLGTPSYFSPEQARGLTLDGRSDVYALGVTLYQAATGTLPFPGDDWYQVMRQHVEEPPPAPRDREPRLSPSTEAILLRCLAKDPAERFQSADELADALRAAAGGADVATIAVPAYLPEGAAGTARAAPRRRAVALAFGALGLLGAGTLAYTLLDDGAAVTRDRLRLDSLALATRDSVPAATYPVALDTAVAGLPTLPGLDLRLAGLRVAAPAAAVIFLDGSPAGQGPVRFDSLLAGRHVVRATLASIPECPTAEVQREVTLTGGELRTVALRPIACGRLALNVTPTPATYRLAPVRGGPAREGSLPLDEALVLPEGEYELTIGGARFCSQFEDRIRVSAGDATTTLRIPLVCQ